MLSGGLSWTSWSRALASELMRSDGDRCVQKNTEGTEEMGVGMDLAQGSGQSNTGAVICPTCKSHGRDLAQPRAGGSLTVWGLQGGWGGG